MLKCLVRVCVKVYVVKNNTKNIMKTIYSQLLFLFKAVKNGIYKLLIVSKNKVLVFKFKMLIFNLLTVKNVVFMGLI